MKIIASVQAKRSSSRGLVHYIAHSKTDPQKEPKIREIFNEYSDRLTVEKSNEFLKNGVSGKRPSNEELHHLVISLKKEDFDRLGTDEKEKQSSLKQITRHAMKKMEETLRADKLDWAAGVHRNTNNPHVHIAINKTYFDKNLEKKTLGKIPVELLPHYKKSGKDKTFQKGILIEAAASKMSEIILEKERSQIILISQTTEKKNTSIYKTQDNTQKEIEKNQMINQQTNAETENERNILARAILAKFYLEKTRENLESIENHGDKRRFKIYDEITAKKRKISLFDLERRAEKTAHRRIKNLKLTDPIRKDDLRKSLVQEEMQKNADGIKRIKTILRELVARENQTLRKRETDYNQIKPLATKIRRDYKRDNKKLPIPNLSFEDLDMLQSESLDKKQVRISNYFERVRKELARERDVPTRSNEEIARLKAKQKILELKVLDLEKQLKDSGERKRSFTIEYQGRKWSLAKVDSFIEKQQQDDQKIVGKISKALGKIGLVERKDNLANLEEIKTAITEKLNEKNEQLTSDLKSERSILKTFDKFFKNDTNSEKEKLEEKFSATELAEVESLAFDLKKADVYQNNWQQQKQFIESAKNNSQNTAESIAEIKQKTIAGRAIAREIMCEIELSRAKEEFTIFKKHKNFQKFEIKNEKTDEMKFVSLKEVEFDSRGSLLDQTIEYFIESSEKRRTRNEIEKTIKEKNTELKEKLKSARLLSKIASAETLDFKSKTFFGNVNYSHAPIFTPKELMTIELRIRQTESKSEAKKLQKILDSANHSEAKNLSAILAEFSAEIDFSKTERNSARQEQQNSKTTVASNEALSKTNKSEIGAKIIQGENQVKGR